MVHYHLPVIFQISIIHIVPQALIQEHKQLETLCEMFPVLFTWIRNHSDHQNYAHTENKMKI
jgi:hypothetical protein